MSDQDFFFDEEEETAKEAVKTSSKASTRSAPVARKSAPKPAARPAAEGSTSVFEQSVSMTVAALMTVVGLLLGVIIGFIIAPDGSTVSTGTGTGLTGTAPTLSEDQLQSGALPEGHPAIDSAIPTDTAETPAP